MRAGAGAVVVVTIGVVVTVMGGAEEGEVARPAAGPEAPPPPPPAPLTAERADALEAGITSGTEAALREVLFVSPDQPLDPAAVAGLATLEPLVIDVQSFDDRGDGTATVTAVSAPIGPDGTNTWTLLLAAEDSQWMLAEAVTA